MQDIKSISSRLKNSGLGRSIRRAVTLLRMPIAALQGVQQYRRQGRVSRNVWARLLNAHCATNGRSSELLNLLTRTLRPPRKPRSEIGLLGSFGVARQSEIANALARDGFYVFPEKLPQNFCDEIKNFATGAEAMIESNRDLAAPLVRYDPGNPVSRTYKIPERSILTNPQMQQLIADPVFIAIAERYLNSHPSIGELVMWWSALYGNEAGSDAAQLFHFDFDAPPAWLKLFVYVTDVGPGNGPHVYVRGSHKAGLSKAAEFRGRGYERVSDNEMEGRFGIENLVEIIGERGTIFMADTRGFHKGKFPTEGDRLVAQIIYCPPFFNDHHCPSKLPANLEPALAASVSATPNVYDRFQ